jgi:colanic acid/amylovoran biosynthesis glycosyltransferase
LNWIKGIPYILEAVKILKDRGIQVSLTIVGEGIELERYKFAVSQLQIEDQVDFYGRAEHNEISKIMSEHKFLIQYSNFEGFCNTVLEAQGTGTIPIVSDAGALPENVIHNSTGFVVSKRNSLKLAQSIESALELSQDEIEKLNSAGRTRVEREFSLEKQKKEFVDFYSN